ncbi:DUF5941 domain-containing protein [Streptomyces sp. NPDC050560]|uniref:DUF5941 domain-containing protein n=1 Tax=Streptomyces sp. NPDC050560 TaxID=3365630 RepID=UPI00379BECDB
MSTAIVTGQPVPGSSLEGDLRSLGFEVRRAADAGETGELLAAAPADERVAVVDGRFVGHRHALRLGLTDPRFDAASVPGAVTAKPAARRALTHALHESVADEGHATTAGGTGTVVLGLPDRVVAALQEGGTAVHRPELGTLVAAVPADADGRDEARRAVDAVDEEAVRLRNAVKSRDGFFTTHVISPYSRYLARWCARRGLTPNQVTTASLLTAIVAAVCAATATRGGFVAAGVLLLASFFLDCTDGQLARYSLQYSTLGAWLDATFDRAKEYAYYAGLALGAARGGDDVWALALGAMVLQTCRHLLDSSFNEATSDITAATAATAAGGQANTSPTAALSDRLDRVGWTVWLRRMIVLPIGERWALIAVLTAVTTPRTVFVVLLVGCGFAACYTSAGRLLRSLTRTARRTGRAARALADLADTGVLAEAFAALFKGAARRLPSLAPPLLALAGGAAVVAAAAFAPAGGAWPVVGACVYCAASGAAVARTLTGPLDWLVPAFFRAAEYGTVLLLAARADVNGALPAAYGLVAAVAYHHYDTVYRIKGGSGAPPRRLVRAIGGHEGRTLLVTVVAAVLSATGFAVALTVCAVCVALVVLTESIRFWIAQSRSGSPAVHDEGETA